MYDKLKNYVTNMSCEIDMSASTCPKISICGINVEVENYKKIYKSSSNEVIILFSKKEEDIKIEGRDLRLKKVNKGVVVIKGLIKRIEYINRKIESSNTCNLDNYKKSSFNKYDSRKRNH